MSMQIFNADISTVISTRNDRVQVSGMAVRNTLRCRFVFRPDIAMLHFGGLSLPAEGIPGLGYQASRSEGTAMNLGHLG